MITVIELRTSECILRRNLYDGQFPVHDFSGQPAITHGHLTFYQQFVSSYKTPEKKQKVLYSFSCKRRNVVPVYLLLCGDIRPCPGSMVSRFDKSSDYKCFQKKGLHFVYINVRSLLPKVDEILLMLETLELHVFVLPRPG